MRTPLNFQSVGKLIIFMGETNVNLTLRGRKVGLYEEHGTALLSRGFRG